MFSDPVGHFEWRNQIHRVTETETEREWVKFIHHNITEYICMISKVHHFVYIIWY